MVMVNIAKIIAAPGGAMLTSKVVLGTKLVDMFVCRLADVLMNRFVDVLVWTALDICGTHVEVFCGVVVIIAVGDD